MKPCVFCMFDRLYGGCFHIAEWGQSGRAGGGALTFTAEVSLYIEDGRYSHPAVYEIRRCPRLAVWRLLTVSHKKNSVI